MLKIKYLKCLAHVKSFIIIRFLLSIPAILITKECLSDHTRNLRANPSFPWVKFPKETVFIKEPGKSPGWCGSVDSVPACEPKGHRFNSQSEHMPGLQAGSPVGSAQ